MRTFIAVDMPVEVKAAIGRYIESLRGTLTNVKWVAPENLHLTVKFLGEVKESVVRDIRNCVSKTASGFSPFMMGLSHMGFFPSSDQPRVIWISSDGGEDQLLDLFQHLENCLEDLGIDRESRTFSPHLTIGRVKRDRHIVVPDNTPEFEHVSFKVNSLALIRSTLTPEGPVYEKLFEGIMNEP